MIWPAAAIAAAGLLMRLPTAPLRWSAVGLFCAINLAQAVARLVVYIEPPVDKVAHDVWAAHDPAGSTRTYVNMRYGPPEPGGGTIYNFIGRYYLCMESGRTFPPAAFRGRDIEMDALIRVRQAAADVYVTMDMQRAPNLDRIVVWDQYDARTGERPDTLSSKLPPGWKLVQQNQYLTWEHWTWQTLETLRRREYAKG
jgi:hypothetical protein